MNNNDNKIVITSEEECNAIASEVIRCGVAQTSLIQGYKYNILFNGNPHWVFDKEYLWFSEVKKVLDNPSCTLTEEEKEYCIWRWTITRTAEVDEYILSTIPGVEPNPDKLDKKSDFRVSGKIILDLKSTKYPYGRGDAKLGWIKQKILTSNDVTIEDNEFIIQHLYKHQSGEPSKNGRFSIYNRFFVIYVTNDTNLHKLKCKFKKKKELFQEFCNNISEDKLQLHQVDGRNVYASTLYIIQKDENSPIYHKIIY